MTQNVDIIIPSWNLSEYTERCLVSVHQHTTDYRVILIDNGSDTQHAQTLSRLSRHRSVRLVRNDENLGFTAAINQGVKLSNAEYVCFLNNDTVVSSGWMGRFIEICSSDRSIGAVGPLSTGTSNWQTVDRLCSDPHPSLVGEFKSLRNSDITLLPFDKAAPRIKEVFTGQLLKVWGMVAFFCVLFPRRVIDIVGEQDPAFRSGFAGDDDYCKRIRRAGFRIVVAKDVLIHHDHRTSFRALMTEEEISEALMIGEDVYRKKWKPPIG